MKTPKEVLMLSLDIIKDPERWTQGRYAKSSKVRGCGILDQAACSWCAMGVILKVCNKDSNYSFGPKSLNTGDPGLEGALICMQESLQEIIPSSVMSKAFGDELLECDTVTERDLLITQYNDMEITEHEHVVKVFRRAISIAKGREGQDVKIHGNT